ncbi:kinase-like domain-containing protein [Phlebopus sp. FC_14]|nr:kinase-like domain-containing protein [Phlebopus sp. FC_14]
MGDSAPASRCIYCDDVVPQHLYNNHMRIDHNPPTAQDLSSYYKKFYTVRKPKTPANPGARNPEVPPPSNDASQPASSPASATFSFISWRSKFTGSNVTVPSVTTDQIASFDVDRSDPPQLNTHAFRKSTIYDVEEIVRNFSRLPRQSRADCCDIVRQMHVFPALSAFVFTHLKMCGLGKPSVMDGFRQKVRYWKSQGEEWCLMNYSNIKEDLLRVLQDSQADRHVCNDKLVAGNRLHALDIHNLGALLVMYSSDQDRANMFYGLEGEEAQVILDLLQALLDLKSDRIDAWYKRRFLDAVIRLSKRSRLYPQSLLINDVENRTPTNKRGGFGLIYKGNLRGRVVAVKELHAAYCTPDQLMKYICAEAVVWRNVRHANCLPFYGVVRINDGGSTSCLVSPWMEEGTLLDYLFANPDAPRLPLGFDIASGLEYLHGMQPTIVHGDLKGLNIFVTASRRACLADFGFASAHDSLVNMVTTAQNVHGTRGFVAPELVNSDAFGLSRIDRRRCDMFAFGCVIYEMYTGKAPLADMPRPDLSIIQGIRPMRPPGRSVDKLGLDDEIWEFVQNLWHQEPEVRPVARMAREFLSFKLGGMKPQVDEAWKTEFLSELAIASDPFALAL